MNSELREKILNTISKNSRYSTKELAAMLGSDETAVTNELKQMEQENVICGYPTLINCTLKVNTLKVVIYSMV